VSEGVLCGGGSDRETRDIAQARLRCVGGKYQSEENKIFSAYQARQRLNAARRKNIALQHRAA